MLKEFPIPAYGEVVHGMFRPIQSLTKDVNCVSDVSTSNRQVCGASISCISEWVYEMSSSRDSKKRVHKASDPSVFDGKVCEHHINHDLAEKYVSGTTFACNLAIKCMCMEHHFNMAWRRKIWSTPSFKHSPRSREGFHISSFEVRCAEVHSMSLIQAFKGKVHKALSSWILTEKYITVSSVGLGKRHLGTVWYGDKG